LKTGWFISWLSRGLACLAPTFQLITEDAIDAGYNKMQVNVRCVRLFASLDLNPVS